LQICESRLLDAQPSGAYRNERQPTQAAGFVTKIEQRQPPRAPSVDAGSLWRASCNEIVDRKNGQVGLALDRHWALGTFRTPTPT